MNKKIFVVLSTSVVLLALGSASHASIESKYFSIQDAVKSNAPTPDPDGKMVKVADVEFKSNKEIDPNKLKKVTDIQGYVPDDELSKNGGKYVIKKLMTYQEYFDLGFARALRRDIDPNRMVWVLQSKFSKTIQIEGADVDNAIVTTVYDAETGEQIAINVTSPNGIDNLKNQLRPHKGGK